MRQVNCLLMRIWKGCFNESDDDGGVWDGNWSGSGGGGICIPIGPINGGAMGWLNIKEFNGDIGCWCCCCCLDGKLLLLLFKPPKVDDGYMPIKTRFISSPEHCMTSTKHFLLAKKKHLPFLCIDAFMAESSPSHCIKHSPEGKP